MAAINSCHFTGRFTSDPEILRSKSGSTYVKFSLAVNDRAYSKQEGQYVDQVAFIPCIAFEDIARYIADKACKGMKAMVTCAVEQTLYRPPNGKDTRKEIVFRVKEIDLDEGYRRWSSKKWI